MKVQREQPPFSTISGTWVRLSERESIAIYRRDGLSWVAHFRDGYGELNDAATWFRAHAGLLRSARVGSVAALDTVEMLTAEMISNIARLHQRVDAERGHDGAPFMSPAVAFGRACAQMLCALQGWRIQRLRRAG